MLQEMHVEIKNSSVMLLAYSNTKIFQKAKKVVVIVKQYLQASFAVLRAVVALALYLSSFS